MSNHFWSPQTIRARKSRRCIYCGEAISVGQDYTRQSVVFEGDWFTNHYHHECYDDLSECDEREFMPYSNDRPEVTP